MSRPSLILPSNHARIFHTNAGEVGINRTILMLPRLVPALCALKPEALQWLASLANRHPPTDLGQLIRDAAEPEGGGPLSPAEAAAGLAIVSLNFARRAKGGLRNRTPLNILAGMGSDGERVAGMLAAIASRKDWNQRSAQVAEIDRVVGELTTPQQKRALSMGRGLNTRALVDPPAIESAPSVAAPAAIAEIARRSKILTTDGLMDALTYGSSDLLLAVHEEYKREPPSRLTTALRSQYRRVSGSSRGNRAARLLAVLHQYRDAHDPKRFRLDTFVQDYGEAGAKIVDLLLAQAQRPQLPKPNFDLASQICSALGDVVGPHRALAILDPMIRNDRWLPKRIPALDHAMGFVRDDRFQDEGMMASIHFLPTTMAYLEAHLRKGMKPKDIHAISTNYAPNPLVVSYGRLKGMDLVAARPTLGAGRSFERKRLNELAGFVAHVADTATIPRGGWNIVDDGALLHGLIHGHKRATAGWTVRSDAKKTMAKLFQDVPMRGLEQTTRGLTELSNIDLQYEIVRVADAPGKIEEGPGIGWALADNFIDLCIQRGIEYDLGRIAEVGAGTVGRWLVRFLKEAGFDDLIVVDTDGERRQEIRKQWPGLPVAEHLGEVLADTDLVFSITGGPAVTGAVVGDWKGRIVSGSSGGVEVDQNFGDDHDGFNQFQPITFRQDGREDLSPKQIGITRALMFLGSAQESTGQKALVPLAEQPQRAVVERWLEDGGQEFEPLSRDRRLSIPLPDANECGIAEHDEWMTFFDNFGGRVTPPLDVTQRRPGVYLCELEDGEIRMVHSELGFSDVVPKSVLPEMPDGLVQAMWPAFSPLLLSGQDAKGKWVQLAEVDGMDHITFTTGRRYYADAIATTAVSGWESDRGDEVWNTFNQLNPVFHETDVELLLRRGDTLTLVGPHDWKRPLVMKLANAESSIFQIENRDLVQVRRQPPAVVIHDLAPRGARKRPKRHDLPRDLAQIDRIMYLSRDFAGRLIDTETAGCFSFAVGRSETGEQVLVVLDANMRGKMARLPEGVVIQGIAYQPNEHGEYHYVAYAHENLEQAWRGGPLQEHELTFR